MRDADGQAGALLGRHQLSLQLLHALTGIEIACLTMSTKEVITVSIKFQCTRGC